MTGIGHAESNLLLSLFEAKVLRFTAASLVGTHGACGQALIDAGFMVAADFEGVGVDCIGDMREVAFDPIRREHGMQDPQRGWVRIERSELTLYAPDLKRLAEGLLGKNVQVPHQGVRQLDAGAFVWEIGSAFFKRAKRSSVWFSRRLGDRSAVDSLLDSNARRPSGSLRLVLTSTPFERLRKLAIPSATVVPIADVLSTHEPSTIDFDMLKVRFLQGTARAITSNLHLSDDGRVLTINGSETVEFRGDIQFAIIRRLVDAHDRAERVNAARLLNDSGSGVRLFSQAFKRQWPVLSKYLVSKNGLWGFEL